MSVATRPYAYPKRIVVNTVYGEGVAEMMAEELAASYRIPTEIGDWDDLVREARLW